MKIFAGVFSVQVGRPGRNAEEMIRLMTENEADVYLFPAYSLTGATCSNAVNFAGFAERTNEALDRLCEYTEETHKCLVTAVAGYENIIIRDGELIQKPAITMEGKRVMVAASGQEEGADVLLLPTAMDGYPCIQNDIIEFCAESSKQRKCVIAVANCGFGESSADHVYKGFAGVFHNGVILDFKSQDTPEPVFAQADSESVSGLIYTRPKRGLDRIPYYGNNDPDRYLDELFKMQVQALYMRLVGTGIRRLILGLSGGLDSTTALLVSEAAMKMAGLPVSDIITVTMPGFGTSGRTKSNALELMALLGTTAREVDIKESVLTHFAAIGHNPEDASVVYENAQARERTQVLLDMANQFSALVVGTGDLSEEAQGFCTFGGDNTAHYNPNATVPKTLLRAMISRIAATRGGDVGRILQDIVDTPISPELKPGQKTEDIIGPYELLDFYLFFFAKRHASYEDIKHYALAVFEEYDEDEIVHWLDSFFARYKASRFKRATVFEGANLIGFTLPYVPADVDFDFANL